MSTSQPSVDNALHHAMSMTADDQGTSKHAILQRTANRMFNRYTVSLLSPWSCSTPTYKRATGVIASSLRPTTMYIRIHQSTYSVRKKVALIFFSNSAFQQQHCMSSPMCNVVDDNEASFSKSEKFWRPHDKGPEGWFCNQRINFWLYNVSILGGWIE